EKQRERQEKLGSMARAKLEEIEMLTSARGELAGETENLMARLDEADKIYEELEGKRARITKLRESISRLPKIIKEAEAGVEELGDAEEKLGADYAEIGHSLEEKMYDVSRIKELSNGKIDEAKRMLLEEVDRLEGLETGLHSLNEIRERAMAGLEGIRNNMQEGLRKADEATAEIRRAEEIDASINDEAGDLRRAVRSALSGIIRIDESLKGVGEAEAELARLQADFDEKRGILARGVMEAEESLEEMKAMETGVVGGYMSELERIGAGSGKGIESIRKRERELAEKLRTAKKELDKIAKEMESGKQGSAAGAVFEIEE
ncbi:MAG: hypothetical protein NT157_06440, partial [Candidatus Micrarchaeota archaeon]|nr:hypothetical protein [Candidatus Micrarchaeota archaeon]